MNPTQIQRNTQTEIGKGREYHVPVLEFIESIIEYNQKPFQAGLRTFTAEELFQEVLTVYNQLEPGNGEKGVYTPHKKDNKSLEAAVFKSKDIPEPLFSFRWGDVFKSIEISTRTVPYVGRLMLIEYGEEYTPIPYEQIPDLKKYMERNLRFIG